MTLTLAIISGCTEGAYQSAAPAPSGRKGAADAAPARPQAQQQTPGQREEYQVMAPPARVSTTQPLPAGWVYIHQNELANTAP